MEQIALIGRLFEAIADSSKGKYIFLCDVRTDMSRWSKNCVEEFGLPSETMKDAGLIWEEHIHPLDRARYHHSIEDLFSGKIDKHDMVYRARKKNGEYVTCTCKGFVVRDDDGNPVYFAGTIEDHSVASEYDTVTGLYTKEKMMETLADYREEMQRYHILFVGIFNLLELNNVYGYEYGNSVLRVFAEKLVSFIGDAEVFCAGGAKFAIVSTECDLNEMKEMYDDLVNFGRHGIDINGVRAILSVGGSYTEVFNYAVPEHTVFSKGMKSLNESMYGKHGELTNFSVSNLDKGHERLVIVNALRNSIIDNCKGFSLVYQPVVDANTEQMIGAEALIRWKKDPFGNVSPADFIAWLEEDPLFYDLGLWIAETAMRTWKDKVLPVKPNYSLSINISYTQLDRPNFRKDLMRIINDIVFPVKNLKIELTERCNILDKSFLVNEINYLKAQGIDTLIDDFGTGFSALELLLYLPVKGIKIDRSFVKGIGDDKRKQVVAGAIIDCAGKIGMSTTVEGIESEEMRGALLEMGTTSFQGYAYSKPLPIDELTEQVIFKQG